MSFKSKAGICASIGRNWPWLPIYGILFMATLLCHGFILSNEGTIWDSWYVLNWLEERKWRTLHDFFDSVGVPLYGWLYRPFAYLGDIVSALMWTSFALLYLNSLLTYHLTVRLTEVSRQEAGMITLLAIALPTFSAVQDLVMFFFLFTIALFLAAGVLAEKCLRSEQGIHWALRIGANILFLLSFSNAALIVFYGGIFVLLFFRYHRLGGTSLASSAIRFLTRFPDFFLLPPVSWILRTVFTPQRGWYSAYNDPKENLGNLGANFWSFFENVLPFHFASTGRWVTAHPAIAGILLLGALAAWRFLPRRWAVEKSATSSVTMTLAGGLLLVLAVLPFAAAGKVFLKDPTGAFSRHCILTNLPLAILTFALLRSIAFFGGRQSSSFLVGAVGALSIVFGAQIPPVYVRERARWIFDRSLLNNALHEPKCSESSVIFLPNANLTACTAYGTYGFASAFGDLTRLVTNAVPANRQFFTASEIWHLLAGTTFLPNEFKGVDPSGQQIMLTTRRNNPVESDWEVVSRYRALKQSGNEKLVEGFLASLTTLQTSLLKPASPIHLSPPVARKPSNLGRNENEFSNGVGMRMIRQSDGFWAAAHEVTQLQFEEVMGANPSLFRDPNRPVERISWNDAMAFCQRLTARESGAGRLPDSVAYRLPTSAEFDTLAAGTTPGTTVILVDRYRWQTEPVGTLDANSQGLHDVIGNVWEWCLDSWDSAGLYRISRGGAWNCHPQELVPYSGRRPNTDVVTFAATTRLFGPVRYDYPDQSFWDRGFRVILAAAPVDPKFDSR